ncbi:MAG: hypothetical protein ACSLEN_07040 [Candidatus Malihini olakiniferum]
MGHEKPNNDLSTGTTVDMQHRAASLFLFDSICVVFIAYGITSCISATA